MGTLLSLGENTDMIIHFAGGRVQLDLKKVRWIDKQTESRVVRKT
jgi:hypothetical protein